MLGTMFNDAAFGRDPSRWRRIAPPCLRWAAAVVGLLWPLNAAASTATMSVNAGTVVTSFIPAQAFGNNLDHGTFLGDYQGIGAQVQAAGMQFLRYPGGSGSDRYHWNGTGTWAGNVWVPDDTAFSSGFDCTPLNVGTSAAGVSALDDGLTTTAWISNPDTDFPNAQWVYVDLGSTQAPNQVQVWWSTPYATSFQVQYWDPAASDQWAPYLDTANHWLGTSAGTVAGTGGSQTVNFTGVSTRFIRLLLTASSIPGGAYAINELKVFNGATQLTTNVNSGSQSQTTASSTAPNSAYLGPSNMDFDDFMAYCNSFSPAATPLITVNFGSGSAQEAAAWVHYANVVKGYHIKHWEIGNEMMGNWEAGGPLSATDYGRRFLEYYAAMTAVDPSIKLVGPVSGPVDASNNLNPNTYIHDFAARLISAGQGSALGGVVLHVYAGYNNDTDGALLPTPASWAGWATQVNSDIAGLPSPGTIPVILSEYNANSAGTNICVRLVNALWTVNWLGQYLSSFGPRAWANFFALLGSGGEQTTTTGGNFGCIGNEPGAYQYAPFADYWGLRMMSTQWAISGDARAHSLVSCASTAANLIGYADLRPDGALSLIVVNQDSANAYNTTLNLSGFNPQANATTFSYSSANYQWQTGAAPYHASPNLPPTQSVTSGVGASFSYTFPAYSITVLQCLPVGTPSPSPTAAAPSPTYSATPSPQPTALVCATKVAYNGETGAGNVNLASGNFYVNGGSTAAAEDAAAAHSGAKGLDLSYNFNSFWGDWTFNWANYSPANAYNLTAYDTMELWVKVTSGTLDYLYVGLHDSAGGASPIGEVAVNTYLPSGVNTGWQRVDIPLSAFSGVNMASIWAMDLYISGLQTGVCELYADDIVFLQRCASPTPTPTPTLSPSPSRSPSATPSRTVSASPSPTPSASPSSTLTLTASPSPSPAGSATLSPSPSLSASITASPTDVPPGSTVTATPTSSPDWTATATPSSTGTPVADTPTPSPCPTASATTTLTPTLTASVTVTVTGTLTASVTPSGTPTGSPGASLTPSGTLTPTLTAMPTASGTPTSAAPATPSPTLPPSPVDSATVTAVPATLSATPSPTLPPSPVASATVTAAAATLSATPSPTANPSQGPLVILNLRPYPNPNPRALGIQLQGPADRLELRLYSEANTRVRNWSYGPTPAGWSSVALPGGWAQGLASGLYFARVLAYRGAAVSAPSKPVRWVLLR